MTIYNTAEELRTALNEVNPSKIAVAFIGIRWKDFLLPDSLKEIILSPTLGSNPYAIQQVIDQIGIDNVHFLDDLHTKIYIGANSALLGSCNLSRNGFSDDGNFEVGLIFSEEKYLRQLNEIFDDYRNKANDLYPDAESKEKRLEELYRQWQVAKESGTDSILVNNGEVTPSILDRVPNKGERIHIAGWSCDFTYNEEVIRAVLPEANNLEAYFSDGRSILENDEIKEGDWILSYRCKKNGYPYRNTRIDWIYIHHVIPNGAECEDDERYTKLVGQAKNKDCPPQPFKLDDQTQALIRDALNLPEFEAFASQESLASTAELISVFLAYLRNESVELA